MRKLVGGEPTCGGLGAGGLQHPEPQLAECDYRDAPFVSRKPVRVESCRLDANENGCVGEGAPYVHHRTSSVVCVSVSRSSSPRLVVSGPKRTSSPITSAAGNHWRRRLSGTMRATGRLSLSTSISSPAATRRSTSAVWLRRSRAGIVADMLRV
ncbi:Uncharacterised protein [Mycobacterium tuberculosis]|nr:Uncharacterised protein [Mycobacterium tuberculosis]